MDVQAALNLIDQNIANLNGTRQSHMELQQAIAVLQNLIDRTIENAKKRKPAGINEAAPLPEVTSSVVILKKAVADKPKSAKKKV